MIKAALTIIGINILAIVLMQWFIAAHFRPESVTAFGETYRIMAVDENKRYGKVVVLNSKNDTVTYCEGSTDLLNDGVNVYWWDVDNDGQNDLYFTETHPRDFYLKFSLGKPPEEIRLSDTEKPSSTKSFWFSLIDSDSWFGMSWNIFWLCLYGIILGIILLIIGAIIYFVKKKKVR
jgi:hypothetical protein